MSDPKDIPLLTDLIESGSAIKMSDLGLDDATEVDNSEPMRNYDADNDISIDPETTADIVSDDEVEPAVRMTPDFSAEPETYGAEISPVLEQTIRRILDEHMELALQEIRIAVQQYLDRS